MFKIYCGIALCGISVKLNTDNFVVKAAALVPGSFKDFIICTLFTSVNEFHYLDENLLQTSIVIAEVIQKSHLFNQNSETKKLLS